MKKALCLMLALVMCLSLCSCGVSKEQVEADLQGTWEYTWYASAVGFNCSVIYTFDDGFLNYTFIRNGEPTLKSGFYTITEDVIEIWFTGEDEPHAKLTYSYEDDKLCLVDYGDGTVENHYKKISGV